MDEGQITKSFQDVKAILNGHFLLSSGNHSDTYVQCAKVMEHPDVAGKLCDRLAEPWRGKGISCVAGPAYGGILIAYELARALQCRAIFFERVDAKFALRRGFEISAGEKILVAEDVVTTGGSSNEVVALVREMKGEVAGVASLVNRGKGNPFGVEFHSLLSLAPPLYRPEECPLCKKHIPVVKPGSRGTVA